MTLQKMFWLVAISIAPLAVLADYNLRLANAQFPDNTTLQVDIQMQTTSGSFDLGGDFGGVGNITEIFVDYSTRGTGVGEIMFDAAGSNHPLGSGYIVNFFEVQSGRARVRVLYNTGTPKSITTAYQTIATLFFDVGTGSSPSQQFDLTLNASTVVYDISDNLQTQGTLSNMVNQPLPVELINFTATLGTSKNVELKWSTAMEQHNDGFEIESSTNGIDFHQVGFVAGRGNYAGKTDYEFNVAIESWNNNRLYYRLKQLDTDGSFEYSQVVTVQVESNNDLTTTFELFPNPARHGVTINTNTPVQVQFISSDGTVVHSGFVDYQERVDLSNLNAGVYVVQVLSTQNEVLKHERLVVI